MEELDGEEVVTPKSHDLSVSWIGFMKDIDSRPRMPRRNIASDGARYD